MDPSSEQAERRCNMIFLPIIKWFKCNFGHVYVCDGVHLDVLYRFRARRGRVALCWSTFFGTIPFVCRLSKDGKLIIDDKSRAGYGKQYGQWTWQYFYKAGFPLENIRPGGYWK